MENSKYIPRRRGYCNVHIQSWTLYLEKDGFVRCLFQNCNFMAFDIDEMALHYGICRGGSSNYQFVCPNCGGETDTKIKLQRHVMHTHGHSLPSDDKCASLSQEESALELAQLKRMPSKIACKSWECLLQDMGYIRCHIQQCDYKALSMNDMMEHRKLCTGGPVLNMDYVCPRCNGRTSSQQVLESHACKPTSNHPPSMNTRIVTNDMIETWKKELVAAKLAWCFTPKCFFADHDIWGIVSHYKTCDGFKKISFSVCGECGCWMTNRFKVASHHALSHTRREPVSEPVPPNFLTDSQVSSEVNNCIISLKTESDHNYIPAPNHDLKSYEATKFVPSVCDTRVQNPMPTSSISEPVSSAMWVPYPSHNAFSRNVESSVLTSNKNVSAEFGQRTPVKISASGTVTNTFPLPVTLTTDIKTEPVVSPKTFIKREEGYNILDDWSDDDSYEGENEDRRTYVAGMRNSNVAAYNCTPQHGTSDSSRQFKHRLSDEVLANSDPHVTSKPEEVSLCSFLCTDTVHTKKVTTGVGVGSGVIVPTVNLFVEEHIGPGGCLPMTVYGSCESVQKGSDGNCSDDSRRKGNDSLLYATLGPSLKGGPCISEKAVDSCDKVQDESAMSNAAIETGGKHLTTQRHSVWSGIESAQHNSVGCSLKKQIIVRKPMDTAFHGRSDNFHVGLCSVGQQSTKANCSSSVQHVLLETSDTICTAKQLPHSHIAANPIQLATRSECLANDDDSVEPRQSGNHIVVNKNYKSPMQSLANKKSADTTKAEPNSGIQNLICPEGIVDTTFTSLPLIGTPGKTTVQVPEKHDCLLNKQSVIEKQMDNLSVGRYSVKQQSANVNSSSPAQCVLLETSDTACAAKQLSHPHIVANPNVQFALRSDCLVNADDAVESRQSGNQIIVSKNYKSPMHSLVNEKFADTSKHNFGIQNLIHEEGSIDTTCTSLVLIDTPGDTRVGVLDKDVSASDIREMSFNEDKNLPFHSNTGSQIGNKIVSNEQAQIISKDPIIRPVIKRKRGRPKKSEMYLANCATNALLELMNSPGDTRVQIPEKGMFEIRELSFNEENKVDSILSHSILRSQVSENVFFKEQPQIICSDTITSVIERKRGRPNKSRIALASCTTDVALKETSTCTSLELTHGDIRVQDPENDMSVSEIKEMSFNENNKDGIIPSYLGSKVVNNIYSNEQAKTISKDLITPLTNRKKGRPKKIEKNLAAGPADVALRESEAMPGKMVLRCRKMSELMGEHTSQSRSSMFTSTVDNAVLLPETRLVKSTLKPFTIANGFKGFSDSQIQITDPVAIKKLVVDKQVQSITKQADSNSCNLRTANRYLSNSFATIQPFEVMNLQPSVIKFSGTKLRSIQNQKNTGESIKCGEDGRNRHLSKDNSVYHSDIREENDNITVGSGFKLGHIWYSATHKKSNIEEKTDVGHLDYPINKSGSEVEPQPSDLCTGTMIASSIPITAFKKKRSHPLKMRKPKVLQDSVDGPYESVKRKHHANIPLRDNIAYANLSSKTVSNNIDPIHRLDISSKHISQTKEIGSGVIKQLKIKSLCPPKYKNLVVNSSLNCQSYLSTEENDKRSSTVTSTEFHSGQGGVTAEISGSRSESNLVNVNPTCGSDLKKRKRNANKAVCKKTKTAINTDGENVQSDSRFTYMSLIKDPQKMVKCGRCGEEMILEIYRKKHLLKHNFLCWMEGETPMDLNDGSSLMLYLVRLRKANLRSVPFVCELCGEAKKSPVGFLSHMQFCGKSEKEKTAMLVKCEFCGRIMMPSSLKVHIGTNHKPEGVTIPTTLPEKPLIIPKSKRTAAVSAPRSAVNWLYSWCGKARACWRRVCKADEVRGSLRASDLIQSLDEDVKGTSVLRRKPLVPASRNVQSMYHKPRTRISNAVFASWKRSIADNHVASCINPGCDVQAHNISYLRDHYAICPLTPNRNYKCNFCVYQVESTELMISHINTEHPTDINDDYVNEGDNSDFEMYQDVLEDADDDDIDENSEELNVSQDERLLKYPRLKFCWKYFQHSASYFALAGNLTYELRQEFFSKSDLYNNLDCSAPAFLNDAEIQGFLPCTKLSMLMQMIPGQWEQLNLFQASFHQGTLTMFVGGPVWAMSWCPSSGPEQYLAVAIHHHMDVHYPLGQTFSHSGLIQIWNVGLIDNMKEVNDLPRLALGLTHDFGSVLAMEWCPSGCFGSARLGLLATATTSGSIVISAVPNPAQLPMHPGRYPIVQMEKSMVLMLHGEQNLQCTRVTWSGPAPHNIIAGGFANGVVALWDLTTTSSLLRSGNTLFPYHTFTAHRAVITALSFMNNGSDHLMTGSHDRFFKYWDLRDTTAPITVHSQRMGFAITDGVCLNHWITAVNAYDDVYPFQQTSMTLHNVRDFFHQPSRYELQASVVWSLAGNDWLNAIACGYSCGLIQVILSRNLAGCEESTIRKSAKPNMPILMASHLHRFKESEEDLIFKDPKRQANSEAALEKVIKRGKKRKYNENAKATMQKPCFEDVPSNYDEAAAQFGVIFTENKTVQGLDIKKADAAKNSPLNMYMLASVNKVAWNPNFGSFLWLAAGYQCGLVRIIRTNYVTQEQLTAFYSKHPPPQ